jgi:hypothetical protein
LEPLWASCQCLKSCKFHIRDVQPICIYLGSFSCLNRSSRFSKCSVSWTHSVPLPHPQLSQ